jgi:hypothetical protein
VWSGCSEPFSLNIISVCIAESGSTAVSGVALSASSGPDSKF